MPASRLPPFSCFDGHRLVASGTPEVAALALKQLRAGNAAGPLLVFDNATGRTRDIDTRGSDAELLARVVEAFPAAVEADADVTAEEAPATPRGRGRPKLGVVAREVTLLPRHWAWLAEQPGGASVVLRKLVEAASRAGADKDRQRPPRERTSCRPSPETCRVSRRPSVCCSRTAGRAWKWRCAAGRRMCAITPCAWPSMILRTTQTAEPLRRC